jgi:antigen flippase
MPSETEACPQGKNTSSESSQAEDSYGRIVTSSSLIGGSQVIGLVLGLFRAKLAAILIGAEGVGLNALLQGIMTLGSTLCGFGLQQSGAREVAAAYADNNRQQLSRTVHLIRRLAWWTGGLGLALAICFATPISEFNFGTPDHRWEIALLGFAILLGNLTTSESAVIQGTRQIGKLAKVGVWSGILGTLLTLGFYLWLGVNGVAPALIAVAAVTWGLTRFASRSIALEPASINWGETKQQTKHLLQFGLAFAINGVMVSCVAYLTRYLVNEHYGLDGVGLFSAAFALSGMFVGFVLSAMSADYYPALTARASDFPRMAELINQQTQVALLLAFPGLLGTLFLAPIGLTLFYSAEFAAAESMLRWFIIGCFAKVLSWPIGFSVLAQGNTKIFLFVESFFNVLHLGLVWLGICLFGLDGVAMAFALVNVLYVLAMLLVTSKSINFTWSAPTRRQLTWMCPIGALGFLAASYPFHIITTTVGCFTSVLFGLICLQRIACLVDSNHRVNRLLRIGKGFVCLLKKQR